MTTGVLTTSFPRFSGDFAGCFVEDEVNARVARGENVEVIAAGPPFTTRSVDPLDERPELAPSVRVFRVRMPALPRRAGLFYGAGAPEALEEGGAGVWLQGGYFWAGLCEQLRRRAVNWQRISAHWLVPSALAAHAVAPRLPLTAYAHSGDIALLERLPGGKALARRLASVCGDLIFASGNLRRRFAALAGGHTIGRLAVRGHDSLALPASRGLSSARDDEQRARVRSALGLTGPTILAVGRLVPIKGFDLLVRAAARVPKLHVGAGPASPTVCILGDGPERPHLERLAQRVGVHLHLPGYVPRPQVAEWMTAADLYVQPSRCLANGRTEGMPTATLEAVAAGLPVIASRSGGLEELASLGIRLVSPNDVTALADALRSFGPTDGMR